MFETGRSGVHGEHDIVFHRPLVPGESLETWSEPWAVRNTRAGMRMVLHMEQFDAAGELVVEQWWTIFFAGNDSLADVGPEPPDHTFPDEAREHPVASVVGHVDADRPRATPRCPTTGRPTTSTSTRRASRASTTCSPTACARWRCARRPRSARWPTATHLVSAASAVRFASPTRLDEDITVDVFEVDPTTYAFEATYTGATVIKHGRLELFD